MSHKNLNYTISFHQIVVATALFFATVVACSAQENNLALGQWRLHLPYNKLNSVAEGNGKVFCAGTDALFIYTKDDGSILNMPVHLRGAMPIIPGDTLGVDIPVSSDASLTGIKTLQQKRAASLKNLPK